MVFESWALRIDLPLSFSIMSTDDKQQYMLYVDTWEIQCTCSTHTTTSYVLVTDELLKSLGTVRQPHYGHFLFDKSDIDDDDDDALRQYDEITTYLANLPKIDTLPSNSQLAGRIVVLTYVCC